MANIKGAVNMRSSASVAAKQSFLPPRIPFPAVSTSYADHGSIGPQGNGKPRDRKFHQRTTSESFLDEQPSWLDDLLNEPETPMRRGAHRRSSSDSFTFFDGGNMYSNFDGLPSWGAQELDQVADVQHASYYLEVNSFGRPQTRGWESPMNLMSYHPSSGPMVKDKNAHRGLSRTPRDPDAGASDAAKNKEQEESAQDPKVDSERKEGSHVKHSQPDADTKRAKQQYAQRSRVRKLQYIAELERKVQALQSDGMEVSAEMEFLTQQNIMLDLENKALKQRLESLAQEHLIKQFQQEMFEREITRLRLLFQQQQQQQLLLHQPPAPGHSRSSSRDLDAQFANLSLKHKDSNTARDPVTGALRI